MRLLKILILLFISSNLFAQQNWTNLLNDDNLNGLIDENNGASIEFAPGIFEDTYL